MTGGGGGEGGGAKNMEGPGLWRGRRDHTGAWPAGGCCEQKGNPGVEGHQVKRDTVRGVGLHVT